MKLKHGPTGARRRSKVSLAVWSAVLAAAVAGSFFGGRRICRFIQDRADFSESDLNALWVQTDYQNLYSAATQVLQSDPMNDRAMVYCGISLYYLSMSQPNPSQSLVYIDEAIARLRMALRCSDEASRPQIAYMLGKAYYRKNFFSSYNYYSDLTIKYLSEALDGDYEADDLHEYLGLAYASIGESEKSIAAFTKALFIRSSQPLLYAIAEQYSKVGDNDMAKQYFARIVEDDTDDVLVLKSRFILAQMYSDEGDYEAARGEYEAMLETNPQDADAHYGLGEMYLKQNDLLKARSEWRKAVSLQPGHAKAMQRLEWN